jgi:CBS domain-containing protein
LFRTTTVEAICSQDLLTASSDQDTSDTAKLMIERAIRRLPVVQNGDVVGIVALGDLAIAMDRTSALGEISAASANR